MTARKTKRGTGRPPGRPPKPAALVAEQQAALLDRHASGETVTAICRDLRISIAAPWRWDRDDPDGFGKLYARAREEHAHALAASAVDIADGRDDGWREDLERALLTVQGMEPKDRAEYLRALASSQVQRDRLRVDARKWATAKALPKIYGEKVDVTSNGQTLEALVSASRSTP